MHSERSRNNQNDDSKIFLMLVIDKYIKNALSCVFPRNYNNNNNT